MSVAVVLISAFFVTIIFRIIGMIVKFGSRVFLGNHAEMRSEKQRVAHKPCLPQVPKTGTYGRQGLCATL